MNWKKEKNENTNDMLRNFNSLLLVTQIIILRSSVTSVTRKHKHTPSYRFLRFILDFRICNRCSAPRRARIPHVHSNLKKGVIFLD